MKHTYCVFSFGGSVCLFVYTGIADKSCINSRWRLASC